MRALRGVGLGPTTAAQEFGRAQYEINLRHGPALDAADRALRLKAVVKDVAFRHGLHATFMGKPRDGDEGSGFHVHVSLRHAGTGANAFDDPAGADGLSATARQLRRRRARARAGPDGAGQPDRQRLPPLRGREPRPDARELGPRQQARAAARPAASAGRPRGSRCAAATAAPTRTCSWAASSPQGCWACATARSCRRPCAATPTRSPQERLGPRLPADLGAALDALEADRPLVELVGERLVELLLLVKRDELARFHAHQRHVTDWERAEYGTLL